MKTSNSDDEDIKGFAERYIRWQGIRIAQLGYVNNLLTILASGSLLWQAQTLFLNQTMINGRLFYLLSAILFLASVLFGCYIAWNRLGDFSLTADRLRSLVEVPPSVANQETKDFRKEIKEESEKLGKITKKLLPLQFVTFLFGVIFVALDIILHMLGI